MVCSGLCADQHLILEHLFWIGCRRSVWRLGPSVATTSFSPCIYFRKSYLDRRITTSGSSVGTRLNWHELDWNLQRGRLEVCFFLLDLWHSFLLDMMTHLETWRGMLCWCEQENPLKGLGIKVTPVLSFTPQPGSGNVVSCLSVLPPAFDLVDLIESGNPTFGARNWSQRYSFIFLRATEDIQIRQ
jgi:hypothetical protein